MLTKKKRSRVKRIILRTVCLMTMLSIAMFVLFEVHARELLANVVDNELEIIATESMDSAVCDILASTDVMYDKLVRTSYAEDGSISALGTDSAALNILKAELSLEISKRICNEKKVSVGVPAGAFTGIVLLSDFGPDIFVKLSMGGSVTTDIKSEFKSAGINQTVHHVYLEVTAEISLTSPIIAYETTTVSNYELCQTVIVGSVPQFYGNLSRQQ